MFNSSVDIALCFIIILIYWTKLYSVILDRKLEDNLFKSTFFKMDMGLPHVLFPKIQKRC